MQIGVINNLRAGRSDKQVARVLRVLRDYPEVAHVETGRAGALPDAIADLARRRLDLLVVNGGDGTLQHTLTEILTDEPFDEVPMVAPLRGGTTNMTAMDLGASRDPAAGLRAVLEAARAGRIRERVVERPVLRVEFDRGRRVECGMFFGAGMIHRAIALTHQLFPRGRNHGALGAGLVTMSLVAKTAMRPREGILAPDKVHIAVDGESLAPGEFRVVIAASLNRLFWRMNPFWNDDGGGIRFTSISSDAKNFGRNSPSVLRGRPGTEVTPENGYNSAGAERVEMRFNCGFTVDGEIHAPRSDEVVVLTPDRRVTFVRA